MIIIRPETSEDYLTVHRVNKLAFPGSNEADLVEALRKVAFPYISLVALVNAQVVGHIFFSPVSIESEKSTFTALGLAPMAVLPQYQRQGIGSALVQEGLKECQRIGYDVVVVIGHKDYYPRFGFVSAKQKGLRCEYDVPDDVFMVAKLKPEALAGRQGLVKYHLEFKNV